MDNMNPHEKERAYEDFIKKRERMYKIGKVVIYTIAISNIVLAVLSFVLKPDFLSLIINIVLSIALFRGVTWVRYFFAVSAGLASIVTINWLVDVIYLNVPLPVIIYFIVYLIYSIAGTIVLFASKSVTEFLYAQKNG